MASKIISRDNAVKALKQCIIFDCIHFNSYFSHTLTLELYNLRLSLLFFRSLTPSGSICLIILITVSLQGYPLYYTDTLWNLICTS